MTHRNTIGNLCSYALLILCGVLLIACVSNPLLETENVDVQGTPVNVSLSFSVSSFQSPTQVVASPEASSKADASTGFYVEMESSFASGPSLSKSSTRSDGTTPLYNLWVFQFSADKKLVKASKIPNVPEPIKDMVTIDVELVVGTNQTIYLVSLGKQYDDVNLSTIKNISELENYPLQSIRYVDGVVQNVIQNKEDIPYVGFCEGVNIVQLEAGGRGYIKYDPTTGFTGGIPMRAMVSKVTFNFSYNVPDLTPSMMVLNNVPTTFCINADASYKPTSFVALPTIVFAAGDFADGNRYEASWYMAPNRQGTVNSITAQKDRYFYYTGTTPTGSAPSDGTYINLWAASSSTANAYALYYIFLGSNTTTDFNINPHTHYIMRSDINVAPNAEDKRVIYTTLKQNIDFKATSVVSEATSTSVTADKKYNFDAAPGRRPIEITALRGTVTVDILRSSGDANPVPVENSWLQLSTSSNYTEAINRKNGGDPNALATSISINSAASGLIKLYLYNDELTNYTTANPTTLVRTLFIRFRFKSETQPEQSYIYRMWQNFGFYLGKIGGERDLMTGVYSHGLVCSDKFNTCGEEYLSYHSPMTGSAAIQLERLKAGIYTGVSSYEELVNAFGVDNRENGKVATRLYSENSKGYSTVNVGTDVTKFQIPAPRRINGKPDLYQYQGKYNSGQGFAARWCYDKNRDTNGNGQIDEDEMVWYLPSYDQVRMFGLSYYGTGDYHEAAKVVSAHFMLSPTFHSLEYPYFIRPYRPAANAFDTHGGLYDVRCVRDVTWPVVLKQPAGVTPFTAAKVEVENGYAVIDASGLAAGTYAYKTTGDAYIRADGRNVRHLEQEQVTRSIACVTSARFRVAPRNINILGQETSDPALAKMSWSEASGFNTAVDKLKVDEQADPVETGCAVYKQGVDPSLGKWRMPTLNEMYLIEMLEKTLLTTNASTGFEALSFSSTLPGALSDVSSYYWTATEYRIAESSTIIGKHAWVIQEQYTRDASGKIIQNKRFSVNQSKESKYFVRCVQDLPSR